MLDNDTYLQVLQDQHFYKMRVHLRIQGANLTALGVNGNNIKLKGPFPY